MCTRPGARECVSERAVDSDGEASFRPIEHIRGILAHSRRKLAAGRIDVGCRQDFADACPSEVLGVPRGSEHPSSQLSDLIGNGPTVSRLSWPQVDIVKRVLSG